jgi:hypothetical protein
MICETLLAFSLTLRSSLSALDLRKVLVESLPELLSIPRLTQQAGRVLHFQETPDFVKVNAFDADVGLAEWTEVDLYSDHVVPYAQSARELCLLRTTCA